MKSLILLVALAVVAVSQAAVVPGPTIRGNLLLGSIGPGDRLLSRTPLLRRAVSNSVQMQDVVYRGSSNTNITAVHATAQLTPYAYPYLVAGGIGANNVTVRVQSVRGYGFNYLVEIWGR